MIIKIGKNQKKLIKENYLKMKIKNVEIKRNLVQIK